MQSLNTIAPYLKDMGKYPRINRTEEKVLGKKIKAGNKDALDTMITSNLKLVVSVAKRYQGKGINYDDLIAEGNLGLICAASRWDYKRGINFSTYAVFWIKKYVIRSLNTQRHLVRSPVNLSGVANSFSGKLHQLELEGNGGTTDAQVKKRFGSVYKNHTISNIAERLNIKYCSLVQTSPSGQQFDRRAAALSTPSCQISLENEDGRAKLRQRLTSALSRIKYGDIVCEMYGLENSTAKSMTILSKKYKVTCQEISRRRNIVFEKLRKRHVFSEFLDYLNTWEREHG